MPEDSLVMLDAVPGLAAFSVKLKYNLGQSLARSGLLRVGGRGTYMYYHDLIDTCYVAL